MAVARPRSILVGIQQLFEESTAEESSRISEFYIPSQFHDCVDAGDY